MRDESRPYRTSFFVSAHADSVRIDKVTDAALRSLIDCGELAIEDLTLGGTESVSSGTMLALVQCLTSHLHTIRVRCDPLRAVPDDGELLALVHRAPQLRHLEWRRPVTAATVTSLSQLCPHLESVSLSLCGSVDSLCFPNVQSLQLRGSGFGSQPLQVSLPQCTSLCLEDVSLCTPTLQILFGIPNLRALTLRRVEVGVESISMPGLAPSNIPQVASITHAAMAIARDSDDTPCYGPSAPCSPR